MYLFVLIYFTLLILSIIYVDQHDHSNSLSNHVTLLMLVTYELSKGTYNNSNTSLDRGLSHTKIVKLNFTCPEWKTFPSSRTYSVFIIALNLQQIILYFIFKGINIHVKLVNKYTSMDMI